MRRYFVVPMIVALFCAGVGAFGATARGSRSVANAGATTETSNNANTDASATSGNQTVSARVANRTRVRTVPAAQPGQAVSARVAVRNTSKNVAKSVGNMNAAAGKNLRVGMGDPIMQTTSARAATKQKAVNMGTKITTATENTVVPEECRNAFDGCMDSFCMLANTSGGRCRCDDRSEELDDVLDQIMKLDSQSKTLAEEGVERLQRGDAVDAIYSMAEDAANKVVAGQKKNQKDFLNTESKSGSKKLDMSMFNSGVFDTDDLFGGLEDNILESDLSDKKGDALRSAATKMCVAKVPSQCKEYSSMLQLVYAQKIKSDCIAYENDLKQQKMNSENLLKTAQKAVRDAAAEAYESKNKYKTTGECVIAFKQCMLGEDACGSGFSKCVIDPTLVSKNASKLYTIKTSKSITVEIAASTYSALEGSRSFCDNVLAQCVDANKNDAVWKQFLVNVAPELKAAEYNAEDDSRRNCAKNVVSCIKEQAAGEGFTEGSDNWYIFTSNTANVQNFCKIPLQQCNAYGTNKEMEDAVMSFVKLSLNALRADRCTTTIKKCLQDSCGEDYSECLGYTVGDLKGFCPQDVIGADCSGKTGFEGDKIYEYVDQVAQGLFLNVDNALTRGCMNAVNTAMTTYCGGTASCSGTALDFSDIVNKYLTYKLYGGCDANDENCKEKNSISEFSSSDVLYCPSKWVAKVNYGGLSAFFDKVSIGSGSSTVALSNLLTTAKQLSANINLGRSATNNFVKLNSATSISSLSSDVALAKQLSTNIYLGQSAKNNFVTVAPKLNIATSISSLSSDVAFQAQSGATSEVKSVVNRMNSAYKNLIGLIESDYNVSKCINGTSRGNFSSNTQTTTKGQTSVAFKNLTNNIKSIVAQSIYDNFSAQFNARVEDLQTDIDAANIQINKVYSDAGKVCVGSETSTTTASNTGKCEMGNCNACDSAEKKCHCIARTYFQHGPVRIDGSSYGEYTWLHDIIYTNGICHFVFNRVVNCGDTATGSGAMFDHCYYGMGNVENAIEFNFALNKDTNISISKCTDSDEPMSTGGMSYMDTLYVGDQTVEFKHCTKDRNNITWKSGTYDGEIDHIAQKPDRGEGACYWCSFYNFQESNKSKPYVTSSDSVEVKGSADKIMDDLFRKFDENDLLIHDEGYSSIE